MVMRFFSSWCGKRIHHLKKHGLFEVKLFSKVKYCTEGNHYRGQVCSGKDKSKVLETVLVGVVLSQGLTDWTLDVFSLL